VLNGKNAEKQGVDQKSLPERRHLAGIYRFRYEEIPDETNGVKKCPEKYQVANQAINKSDNSHHKNPSLFYSAVNNTEKIRLKWIDPLRGPLFFI
jgi:hypothetical protein